jgi:hypothetical protein
MLMLMTASEDIRQHIIGHGIKTVLGLLDDHNLGVHSSVPEVMSELLKYGTF